MASDIISVRGWSHGPARLSVDETSNNTVKAGRAFQTAQQGAAGGLIRQELGSFARHWTTIAGLVPKEARAQAKEFIEQAGLQVIVVDEPDAPALRNDGLLPEIDRWRVRMEFREAVRGTNVTMILPG